jgi:hypothetical protein
MFIETKRAAVFVDDMTSVGSAFGTTPEGESVFINARIVEAVKIKAGDCVSAMVLPNYEDKRAKVPWRAVRAEVIESVFEDISGEPDDETPLVVQASKDEQIVEMLEKHGPLRNATLARLLGISSGEAGTLCHGLFALGKIALADIYSDPTNKRASHRVWAIDINDFDVDPFDETNQA